MIKMPPQDIFLLCQVFLRAPWCWSDSPWPTHPGSNLILALSTKTLGLDYFFRKYAQPHTCHQKFGLGLFLKKICTNKPADVHISLNMSGIFASNVCIGQKLDKYEVCPGRLTGRWKREGRALKSSRPPCPSCSGCQLGTSQNLRTSCQIGNSCQLNLTLPVILALLANLALFLNLGLSVNFS